jgi:hypothetical protein
MRTLLFAAVAAATGAGGVTVMQTMVPGNASMMEAVRALGGDPSKFRISDININPAQAYRDVMKKVTSGDTTGVPKFEAKKFPDFKISGSLFKPYEFKMDPSTQRAINSGISARIGQDIRRSQDIATYGRNPMAWRGPPPR